jgi:hypothetical protein
MLVVAVLALGIGIRVLWQRSRQYELLAVSHEMEERRWHESEVVHQEQADLIRDDRPGYEERLANGTAVLTPAQYDAWAEEHASMARESRAHAVHHSRLKNVYRSLARQPWNGPDGLAVK